MVTKSKKADTKCLYCDKKFEYYEANSGGKYCSKVCYQKACMEVFDFIERKCPSCKTNFNKSANRYEMVLTYSLARLTCPACKKNFKLVV